MKKILFGTAVAAAAMLSACETLAPQDGVVEGTVQETERIILTARFDNLGKGASGAAIQNMNILMGLPEATGLNV